MAGTALNVTIKDREVHDLMSRITARSRDARPAFSIVGEIVRTSVVRNFEEGGRPYKWKVSGRAAVEGGKTLVDSARLMKSYTSRAYRDHVVVGSDVEYAGIHHHGGKIKAHTVNAKNAKALRIPTPAGVIFRMRANIPEVTMPARPHLMVQDEDWPEIRAALLDHLTKGEK